MGSLRALGKEQYKGELNAFEAAGGIQAARLNATSLLETSRLLLGAGRWGHALALAILANEEAGKPEIILRLFLRLADPGESWRAYRTHTAKTASYNCAIESRAHAVLGPLSEEVAQAIREAGPTPEIMDATKQLLFYSDCLLEDGRASWCIPNDDEVKDLALQAFTESVTLVGYLRDYPPEELEVWKDHWDKGRKAGLEPPAIVLGLHEALVAKGLLKEGQWEPIIRELRKLEPDS